MIQILVEHSCSECKNTALQLVVHQNIQKYSCTFIATQAAAIHNVCFNSRMGLYTCTHTDRHTHTQTDRHTHTHTHTDRQMHRQTDRHTHLGIRRWSSEEVNESLHHPRSVGLSGVDSRRHHHRTLLLMAEIHNSTYIIVL